MIDLIVKDFMQTSIPKLTPDTELSSAITLLQQHKLIGSPVVNNTNHLVGYISEHELLKPILDASYFCDKKLTLADVMVEETVFIAKTSSLINLAEQMLSSRPKNYPVVTDNNQVIGVINRTHVLAALGNAYNQCHLV